MDTNYLSNILKFNDIIVVILCYYLNCICVLRIRKCVITVIIKSTTNMFYLLIKKLDIQIFNIKSFHV